MRFDGQRLKALRIARKWDQHRLAESARSHGVGITQSQISRYENGQEPSGRNALALASALKVSVKDLYESETAEVAEPRTVGGDHHAMLAALAVALEPFLPDRETQAARA